MKKNDYNTILFQIALKEKKSIEQVKAEMEDAIDYAYRNPDPQAHKNFVKMFGEKRPTVEEFLDAIYFETQRKSMN